MTILNCILSESNYCLRLLKLTPLPLAWFGGAFEISFSVGPGFIGNEIFIIEFNVFVIEHSSCLRTSCCYLVSSARNLLAQQRLPNDIISARVFHDKGWHATIDEQHHFCACIHAMTWRAMLAFERHGDVSSEYDYIVAV